jgi:hypothetical protein
MSHQNSSITEEKYSSLPEATSIIQREFNLDVDLASKLAEDALSQIEAHGGNPEDMDEVRSVISVVVSKWIKGIRDQK